MDTSESDRVTGLARRCAELEALLAQERVQQQAAAAVLALLDGSPVELQRVFDTIVATAAELCSAEFAFVLLLRDGRLELVSASNANDDFVRFTRANPLAVDAGSVSGRAVHERRTVHLADCTADPHFSAQHYQLLGGHRTILGVPLLRDGAAIGVFTLMRAEVSPFTQRQIELVETFAAQAVIAIENSRLFEAERERAAELTHALKQQAATAEVLKTISRSALDLQTVLDVLTASSVALCDADLMAILRREGDAFRYVTNHGIPAEHYEVVAGTAHRPDCGSLVGMVLQSRATVHLPDVLAEPRYSFLHIQRLLGFRSMLGVPMLRDGEVIGVLNLMRKSVRPFAPDEIRLVETFADQAVIAINNAELFASVQQRTRDLQQALDHQTATGEVLGVISRATDDLQPVLDTIVATSCRLCRAGWAVIFRLLEDGLLHCVAGSGGTQDFLDYVASRPRPVDRGSLVGRAVLEARPIHVADVLEDPEYRWLDAQRAGGYRTALAVPLMRGGTVLGVIALQRNVVEPFSAVELEAVTTFADQAVIAIGNVGLFQEVQARTEDLQQALDYQTATSEVLSVISRSAFDVKRVFEAVGQSALRLCEAERAFIFRYDGDLLRTVVGLNASPALLDFIERNPIRPGRHSATARAAFEKRTVHIDDVTTDPEYTYGARNIDPLRTNLAVPILKGDRLLGVITIYRLEVNPFTPQQIALLETFADQVAIAVENAGLFEEVEARTTALQHALDYQTAASEVLSVISRSPGAVGPVLDAIVERAAGLCDAADCAVFLREGDEVRLAAWKGTTPRSFERLRLSRETVLGRAVLEGRSIEVDDLVGTEEFPVGRAISRDAGVRTVLAVPLIREGEARGVITLRRTEVRPFSREQVARLSTFADQAAIAIENARLFQEVRARSRELQEALEFQTATSEVLSVISRSPRDVQPVLDSIVETARRLCGAERSAFLRRSGDGLRVVATGGESTGLTQVMISQTFAPDRSSVSGRVIVDRCTVHILDVQAEPELVRPDSMEQDDRRTVLAVPLRRAGEVEGVIVLIRTRVEAFTQRQVDLVETFADQAIIAIENARLFGELEARTGELAASLENLRATQDRLVQTEKLASLGQLTAGIAHEIKNPLNSVNNFAKLSDELLGEFMELIEVPTAALDPSVREEAAELLGMVRDNLSKIAHHGGRADSIVKNMLQHARHGSAEWRMADVNPLIDEALNLAYHGARAEHPDFTVEIDRSLDPDLGKIECCPQDLTRVILNLVSNGIYAVNRKRATAPAGFAPRLDVTTRNSEDGIEIEVRDNGSGIPPEVRDRIFLPFFTTKPAGEGTGLGLSISHDIVVEQHRGTFSVESEPGSFTLFRVTLPRSPGRKGAEA